MCFKKGFKKGFKYCLKKIFVTLSLAILAACSPKVKTQKPIADVLPAIPQSDVHSDGSRARVLIAGAILTAGQRERAKAAGITVEGDTILQLEGRMDALLALELDWTQTGTAAWDSLIRLGVDVGDVGAAGGSESPAPPYVAGREFGLDEFLKACPECDGRGVLAGVLDDGISPISGAFQKTSDGKRKFIRKGSASSMLKFRLEQGQSGEKSFTRGISEKLRVSPKAIWAGRIEEAELKPIRGGGKFDLNFDGKLDAIDVAAFEVDGVTRACVDANANSLLEEGECRGTFPETGEFGWWNRARQLEWTAEFDLKTGVLSLTEGERTGPGESHGEGVGSVLVGNGIGGRWNGVAPGARLLDYDIWTGSAVPGETLYTMGQFVRALEWFGQYGAEVVNISYALHFASPSSQAFMRSALDALVKRYNFVISVSAGNDGPGLGSLHRRGIFPPGVLVTGAFISRELAENVNGESGVPEEGRVTYYSSRGPGPDGGSAPTVIGPVSSVVHRTPGGGFTSFSGTSSASPAVAGIAAVLISALKKEGLPVLAPAVVHALRLSARKIKGTAFIDQGYGVPQIGQALKIYRRLLRGEEFAYAEAEFINLEGADGIAASGWLIRSSQVRERLERREARINLRGVSVAREADDETIRPVLLRYSHSFLSGPRRLWISQSPSKLSLDIDLASVSFARRGGEVNAEVEIMDEETGNTLVVIPVTILDDFVFDRKISDEVELGTEEGTRIHFKVPPGVSGFRLKSRLPGEMEGYLELKVYDSSGNMTYGPRIKGGDSEVLVPFERPGYYQLTLFRVKGAGKPYRFAFTAEPVFVRLATRFLDQQKPVLQIEQFGDSEDYVIDLFRESEVATSAFVLPNAQGEYVLGIAGIRAAGIEQYNLEISPADGTDHAEVSDFVPECYWTRSDEVVGHGRTHTTPAGFSGSLTFSCRAFEHLGGAWPKSIWKMTIKRAPKGGRGFLGRTTWIRLVPGMNRVSLEPGQPVEPGAQFAVWMRPVFGAGALRIGTVEAFSSASR